MRGRHIWNQKHSVTEETCTVAVRIRAKCVFVIMRVGKHVREDVPLLPLLFGSLLRERCVRNLSWGRWSAVISMSRHGFRRVGEHGMDCNRMGQKQDGPFLCGLCSSGLFFEQHKITCIMPIVDLSSQAYLQNSIAQTAYPSSNDTCV